MAPEACRLPGSALLCPRINRPRISDLSLRLTDPRRGKLAHPHIDLVTIALCATTAGTDDFVAMIAWARRHQQSLAQFLDLSQGIPSRDRPNMLPHRLKPEKFEL